MASQDGEEAAKYAYQLLVKEMPKHGLHAENGTYEAVMGSCAKRGFRRMVLRTLTALLERRRAREEEEGLPPPLPSSRLFTIAIHSCREGGSLRAALSLLDSMIDLGIAPNVVTYTALLGVCRRCSGA